MDKEGREIALCVVRSARRRVADFSAAARGLWMLPRELPRGLDADAERKRFAAAGTAGHQQCALRRSVSWLPFAVLPTIFLIGRAAPKHLAFKGYGAAIGVYTIISAGMYLSGDDDE